MRRAELLCSLAAVSIAGTPQALAQRTGSGCRVEAFQGAATADGATTRMTVPINAGACSIVNYGVPTMQRHPADAGSITVPPQHGTAEFVPPRARYTPQPGYIGPDEFTYEAAALGHTDQPVRLKVRVKVDVVAAGSREKK